MENRIHLLLGNWVKMASIFCILCRVEYEGRLHECFYVEIVHFWREILFAYAIFWKCGSLRLEQFSSVEYVLTENQKLAWILFPMADTTSYECLLNAAVWTLRRYRRLIDMHHCGSSKVH